MAIEHTSRKATEQKFSLYTRSLHPELFDIIIEREIYRDFYASSFWVIGASHVVTFSAGDRILTEILADHDLDVPVQHRVGGFSFAHHPQKRFSFDNGVRYDGRFDVQQYDVEGFRRKLRDIKLAVMHNGVYHVFDDDKDRECPTVTAVGYLPHQRSLNVRTFHTFPAEMTIIETHSRWEVRYGG
jgi:hypothetical protein